MKEFFGIGGYQRSAEGFLSWQHLTFVTGLMVIMVALGIGSILVMLLLFVTGSRK